jgi:hypothetical protein
MFHRDGPHCTHATCNPEKYAIALAANAGGNIIFMALLHIGNYFTVLILLFNPKKEVHLYVTAQ